MTAPLFFSVLQLLTAGAPEAIHFGHPCYQSKHPGEQRAATGGLIGTLGTAPVCVNTAGGHVPCAVNMQYFGGHVVSNVKVYAVFWSAAVGSDIQSGVAGFYSTLVNSEWVDWLTEYSTNRTTEAGTRAGQPGSQQTIGRGTFAGNYTLTTFSKTFPPCAAPDQALTCITDADIATEINWQVGQGRLPLPDANTLYMVHFPGSVLISDPGHVSCQDFCAYHSTYQNSAMQSVFYAVLPDVSQPGCLNGCGSGSTFQKTCAAASHELAEVLTDGESGLASGQDYPLAWYDTEANSQGEIGDMCRGHQDTIGHDGLTGCSTGTAGCYTVQQVFSQVAWSADPAGHPATPACVSSRYDGNDYSIALSPNTLALGPGATSAPIPILTTLSNGAPLQLTLSSNNVPTGLHASIDTTSVTVGGAAHLTVSADANAAPVRDAVLVVVAAGATTHSAALLVQVDTSPTISITSPAAGATISGVTAISVAATPGANTSIASISIAVDANAPLSSGPASTAPWNTRTVSNGSHAVQAVVVDSDGGRATASLSVTVANTVEAVVGGCSCGLGGNPSNTALFALVGLAFRLRRGRGRPAPGEGRLDTAAPALGQVAKGGRP